MRRLSKPSTREEYREVYLRSEHWKQIRLAALERAEHRCQVCNRDGRLDVHHRTYERLGEERPADLTVLCRDCHDLFHRGSTVAGKGNTERRKARRKARKRAVEQRKIGANGSAAIYVSPPDRERYSQMMEAERERRRAAKREHKQRQREVEQRRLANARSQDPRQEQRART